MAVGMESRLWAVILAGGAGTRLVGLTGGVPKQFWQPSGAPSLLEQTLARLTTLVPADRCVIVIDAAQHEFVSRCALGGARVVAPPENRGTAAAVLYGLLSVLTIDPQAVVLITPADHGVVNPSLFLSALRKGVRHVTASGGVVLFGVGPSMAHTDHGWIAVAPGAQPSQVQRVAAFVEKPGLATARELLQLGALVNTMVIAARARTLLQVCREQLPDLTGCFVGALTLPPDTRDAVVRARYPFLAKRDFSRDVLTGADGLLVYRIPAEAGWSDLGTPDRVAKWLASRRDPVQALPGRQIAVPTPAVESINP
jgi:mannose-1-phosphate guanylyltransferase